jgi:hypothetical protein
MSPKRRKAFFYRIKMPPACTGFTFCLPGSPKVNAGGACGAWLPGREFVADFRFDDPIEGTADLIRPEVALAGMIRMLDGPKARKVVRGNLVTSSCNGWWRTPRSVAEIAGVQV